MSKRVITSTRQLADGRGVVLKESENGMGAIRCPHCQGVATPQIDHTGRSVLRCGCGATFQSRKF